LNNWTKALLIALRIAIGWHFLYEGLWKIDSDTGSASYESSWYTLYSATAALRAAFEPGDATPDPTKADVFYDDVIRGLRARGRSPSEEQRARLAELRDKVKLAAASVLPGRPRRDPIVGFDWLDLRDEVLKLPAEPPSARFSSRPFLQASAGPFRPLFRGLVSDIDGLERLTPASAQAALDRRHAEILRHYERAKAPFTSEQQQRLAKHRDALKAAIVATLAEPPIAPRIEDYERMRERVAATHTDDIAFSRERLDADRGKLDATADELLALVNEPVSELAAQAQSMATVEQLAAGPLPRPAEPGARIDWLIRWGLTAIGLCLILGLATPVAAIAAALQLAAFYLASPPWPGLPATAVGGHYLYVDRNLIELIAVLAIAGAGTGRWLGTDALVGKWWRRRRAVAGASRTEVEQPATKPATKPAEEPATKPADKPADKPATKPADKPARVSL
jgi:uncharacterized membrane protein YphA (DoxX/SURF4 family)